MEWLREVEESGITHREFVLDRDGRPVPGTLWHSESSRSGGPLICLGHGASGDCYQVPIPRLARELAGDLGYFALAIDGPVHGRRRKGDGAMEATLEEWERVGCVEDMIADWKFAIDSVQALPEVGAGDLGYWGVSMGTIFGLPLVATEQRIKAAVLGLMGIRGPAHYQRTVNELAPRIQCPLLYLLQLEDEQVTRAEGLQMFDAIGSKNKRLHANPGLHDEVPMEELLFSKAFLIEQLGYSSPARAMMWSKSD